MLERIIRSVPDVSEKLARDTLNSVQDSFSDETEIIEKEVTGITTTAALSYTLDDRHIEVKTVWFNGEELPPFQAHRDGDQMWKIESQSALGDTLVVGEWDASDETFSEISSSNTVAYLYSARATKFTSSNMTTESELPSRFHSALVQKSIHDLLLEKESFTEQDLARKRELFGVWKEAKQEALKIASRAHDGSRYQIVHRGF